MLFHKLFYTSLFAKTCTESATKLTGKLVRSCRRTCVPKPNLKHKSTALNLGPKPQHGNSEFNLEEDTDLHTGIAPGVVFCLQHELHDFVNQGAVAVHILLDLHPLQTFLREVFFFLDALLKVKQSRWNHNDAVYDVP